MGANAPRKPVVPRALEGNILTLEGQTIEIRGTQGPLAHRPYAWIPSIKAVVGNIGVFGNMHVWTADTQTRRRARRVGGAAGRDGGPEARAGGARPHAGRHRVGRQRHSPSPRTTCRPSRRTWPAAKTSAELINAMKQAYPQVTDGAMSLDIGAKVNKGEMKW